MGNCIVSQTSVALNSSITRLQASYDSCQAIDDHIPYRQRRLTMKRAILAHKKYRPKRTIQLNARMRAACYHAATLPVVAVLLLLPLSLFLLVATALLDGIACSPVMVWLLDLALITYLGCGMYEVPRAC